jgi:D-3-phosphoglycerate dehydrogenase / 2-oxoglutarate reductase
MKKVLIPTKLDGVAKEILTAHGGYEVVQDEATPLDTLLSDQADTFAMIVRSEKVTAEVIDALPNLKVVVRAGAGFNTIDTKYARTKGIDVMNTPGANSNAVAEEVVAMMLADARHVIRADASTRVGKWEKKQFMGRELAGKTVGIVGLGYIGQLVIKRLSGFDCKFLGYDPVISTERAEQIGVSLTTIEELFSTADYISLHIPENDETRGFVSAELLGLVKDGVTIVNCARAGIIDEEALRQAKVSKSIRFLNDVYAKDAAGDKSVTDIADLMLPHLGASTAEANYKAAQRAAEQLIDFEDKGVTSFVVNRDIPEGLNEHYCELAYALARLCRCIVTRSTSPKLIETSFYGSLQPFAEWLTTPIVAGICDDCDRTMTPSEAQAFLAEMGIDYIDREIDQTKKFENSITVDLTAAVDPENDRHVSVRGTVEEGIMLISRINEFDKLYFEPVGPTLFFLYDDRPGVIGAIGKILAEASVNIEDMRNPHDPRTNRSLAIVKVNQVIDDETMATIKDEIQARAAFCMKF